MRRELGGWPWFPGVQSMGGSREQCLGLAYMPGLGGKGPGCGDATWPPCLALSCPQSIETLRVDGSGRHSFHAVLRSHTEPLGLAVFESRFFWTDGTELVSATWASPQEHAVLLRASISAFTVLHTLQQPPSEYPACASLLQGWQHGSNPRYIPGC